MVIDVGPRGEPQTIAERVSFSEGLSPDPPPRGM